MNDSPSTHADQLTDTTSALTPTLLTWVRLMRVHTRIINQITAFLRAWDLPLAQFDALAQIAADEGLCQQDLALRLLETKGNISRLLDRLMARGWLERRSTGHANRLYLTEAGRALAQTVIPAQNALVTDLFASLASTDRRQLHALLRHFDRGLREGDRRPTTPARG
jgi:DNA-binding MarR family transcriptional regulator